MLETSARPRRRRALGQLTAVLAASAAVILAASSSAVADTTPTTDGFNPGPTRLIDTRIDLPDHPAGPIDGFTQVTLPDSVGNTDSALLSVTVISPNTSGFIKVYPDGTDAPATADVNFIAGPTWAQSVVVAAGAQGKVDLDIGGNSAPINLIVDVIGALPSATYTSLVPAQRAFDSRSPGTGTSAGKKGPGVYAVNLTSGEGGIPTNARAVAVTLTQTGATGNGYLAALSGTAPTGTSSLNYTSGTIASNLVWVAPLAGKIYVQVFGSPTDVIVDVKGYSTSDAVTVNNANRIADTRSGLGGRTGAVNGTTSITLPSGAPAGANYALLNVTATQAPQGGFVASYQATAGQLQTSSLNYDPNQTVGGFVLAPIVSGKVSFFIGAGATKYVADVEGYITNVPTTTDGK